MKVIHDKDESCKCNKACLTEESGLSLCTHVKDEFTIKECVCVWCVDMYFPQFGCSIRKNTVGNEDVKRRQEKEKGVVMNACEVQTAHTVWACGKNGSKDRRVNVSNMKGKTMGEEQEVTR